ncbi:hypothetical protein GCM10011492_04890 [Flexivirga endophytica]|uniref:DUF4192 domain-containing protein n=1 Tax=Flexivirga endophytica TaxID=1849103 RepID=A0A916SVC9_9MICO|nr:DUF4192 family protein [Flexivirga endophytica]GGB18048.1 hypothetical protein GCM10011492_04890 [Flexivirga endophytica]GHB37553.1 hypothetical protein GCM10008112_02720 [Flexivirga endophytica]
MASSLHGIGDVVAYLPYELGYIPKESLAVIGLRDGQLKITARLNRPDSSGAVPLAQHVATRFERAGPDREPDDVVVLCYGPFGAADRLFVMELRSLLVRSAVPLSHVGVVRDGAEWRAEQCSCDGCPRDWAEVPPATSVGPVAERVLQGVVPAENRADLEHRFHLRHPLVAAAVESRLRDGPPMHVHTAQVLPRVLLEEETPVHALPIDVLAGATVAVEPVEVRDQVLSWLMPDFLPPEVVEVDAPVDPHHLGLPPLWLRDLDDFDDPVARVSRRLEEWIGCIPPPRSVPVLLLVAGIQWTTGSGVLATMAVDRALDIEPECKLAVLLAAALRAGLHPAPHRRPA